MTLIDIDPNSKIDALDIRSDEAMADMLVVGGLAQVNSIREGYKQKPIEGVTVTEHIAHDVTTQAGSQHEPSPTEQHSSDPNN